MLFYEVIRPFRGCSGDGLTIQFIYLTIFIFNIYFHLIFPFISYLHISLFGLSIPILNGDSVSSIAKRMSRLERGIKDPKRVKLYRYDDPAMGPRTMPNPTDMFR